jgi:hypothetical protein
MIHHYLLPNLEPFLVDPGILRTLHFLIHTQLNAFHLGGLGPVVQITLFTSISPESLTCILSLRYTHKLLTLD